MEMTMKKILFAAILTLATAPAFAGDVYVAPHVTKNGTYVEGHHRTSPDSTLSNNYSTQGNVNPYTGQAGTVSPYQPTQQPRQPQYPIGGSQNRY